MAFRKQLLSEGAVNEQQLKKMDREIDAEIEGVFEWAQKGPLPRKEDLLLHLFAG